MTKTKTIDSDLNSIIHSLKDQTTSLLVVDSKLCPHSKRLLEEIMVASSLQSSSSSGLAMHILDLSNNGPADQMLPWLPGVPCLLANSRVHLGVDAFAKCRELYRTGITIHLLST